MVHYKLIIFTLLILIQGKVYHASDLIYGDDVAVKIKPKSTVPSVLMHEYHVLCQLKGITGIPRAHWFGYEAGNNALILDYFGPSLEDVFNAYHRLFQLSTIALIADQLVSLLNNAFII